MPGRAGAGGMRIGVAGKGGSGKTTIAGTLARVLAQAGRGILAVDADSNPNLASMVGIRPEEAARLEPLPRDLLVELEQGGKRRVALAMDPAEIVRRFAIVGPDGVRLVLGGRVDHAGAG